MEPNSGKTNVTKMTLAAILTLSLVVNLPGLAVSPMLSTLSRIFPDTTQTQKQLLTVMPNLIIIPFVLLSGKLSMTRHKVATILFGLLLFVGSAIAYMFANSMTQLIIISCTLGCGAGLIIPFAAGLIADCFKGNERMKMMGIKSGISNLSLVIATFAVGWLSSGNWHLPFIVYLIGLVPLALAFKLNTIPSADLRVNKTSKDRVIEDKADGGKTDIQADKVFHGFFIGKISGVVAIYAFITFVTMIITYYAPFMIQARHLPDSLTGTITSIYYLFVFLPGFFLPKVVKISKAYTFVVMALLITIGLALFAFTQQSWLMCVGSAIAGLGYGTCQPLIYDKASRTVESPVLATMALAIVLTANYVAIALTPFIVDIFRTLFNAGGSETFPFLFGAIISLGYFIISMILHRTFGLNVDKSFYQSNKIA